MNAQISRRTLLRAPLLLAACGGKSAYFGSTAAPRRQSLTFALGPEPQSLDPAKYGGAFEVFILPSLFEGLISYHPQTVEPAAGLATHCEINDDATRFTFYLRGHPNPRGLRLPNTDSLRTQYQVGRLSEDFSRGRASPPDRMPAQWTDGQIVTAYDFVYSWRRVIDPATAAPLAYLLYYVRNGREIYRGTRAPEHLGVRALDAFTFQVDLETATPFFLALTGNPALAATPRQSIEAARQRGSEADWTLPSNMVTSGAFVLQEWRPCEHVLLVRNPRYYEAGLVALEEIKFLSLQRGATIVNLYKTGQAHAMPGDRLPVHFLPVLESKRDFHVAPAVFGIWSYFNTKRFPFDDVLVRYAVNMAIDKSQIVKVLGAGRTEAKTLVPPMPGYKPPAEVLVTVRGRSYNILAHDPEGARALMAASQSGAGLKRGGKVIRTEFLFAEFPLVTLYAVIMRQQLREILNIDLALVPKEYRTVLQTITDLQFSGLAHGGGLGMYVDPNDFLGMFVTDSGGGTGWADVNYDAMLADANRTLDPADRMQKLSQCEHHMLAAMPLLPLLNNTLSYLQKPFVRGLTGNILDLHPFKYAWIDTNWRAS
jgi:oligopeptide transport system substrate-binding protein